ncbi:tRNA lysidine(34) synthetase TilS [Candidatus Dependentiae bacterium]|nr:tRNA lysidine(34) synthetase TilS [Candidatus Dependentiae bacterium]
MVINKQLFKYSQSLVAQVGDKPTVIVALSGGPDSVFLLYLLKQLRDARFCSLVAAHLNHGWRAEAADDAAWCKALCAKLGVPFVQDHGDNYPVDKKYGGSAEAIGRKKRQLFYTAVKTQYQAAAIALGHHQDDQFETFFIRLARGTSLSGLHGMNPFDGTYLRPLLCVSKKEILAWLAINNISYLTDATNAQDKYLRNRIRHYLVPALKQCDARFEKSITTTMIRLKEEDLFLDALTKEAFLTLFQGTQKASLPAFLAQPAVLQRRLIMHWLITEKVSFCPTEGLIEEILRFLSLPEGGTHHISSSHILIKQKSRISLENTVG